MKLQLKKVKVIPRMSEETTCFYATLYVDGKPAAECSNSGKGGMTDVRFEDSTVRDAVVKYCKENPVVNYFKDKKYVFEGVDIRVDELLVEHQMKKELNKMQKKHLVLHNNRLKDPNYVIHTFLNLKLDIAQMLEDNVYRRFLATQIKSFRQKGFTVMNTNINYKALGVD